MNITLVEWLKLNALRKKATEAADELSHALAMLAIEKGHGKEAELLMKFADKADDAKVALGTIDTDVQSEWMGGPTQGPGSEHTKTYMREPYCCGRRDHFTAKEVQDAKDAGLLKGGPDLTGPKER